MTTPLLLVSALLQATGSSAAGERALLLVDPSDATSLHVANHYAAARDVPASNLLCFDPAAADYAALAATELRAFRSELALREIADTVDFVVVSPTDSFYVDAAGLLADPCSAVRRFSLPAAYAFEGYESLLLGPGTPTVLLPNTYGRAGYVPAGFRSEDRYWGGVVSTVTAARRTYAPAMLGWTGARGNTEAEVLAMIDRSALADDTWPAGTAYYMETTDPLRSGPRDGAYPTAVTRMSAVGGMAEHLFADLPTGRQDVLGVMTGRATLDVPGAGMNLLPGTFADHLTSYAGAFDVASQTKMSRWIAAGASGTSGTVEEPCNYSQKFPHAGLHVNYRDGLSLGEAWYRSMVAVPFQNLFVGDPLTRPWSLAPDVLVPDAPAGTWSGVVTLTPNATPRAAGAGIARHELFIDGRRVAQVANGASFALDTTTLDEGWHEMRVRSTDDAVQRSTGLWRRWVRVDNLGRSVTLVPSQLAGDLGTTFDLQLDALGGDVDQVQVLHAGRVVAALDGDSGTVPVAGALVGAGPARLQAIAYFADGGRASSAVVELDVADAPGTPAHAAPVAFSYRRYAETTEPFVLDLPAHHTRGLGGATYTILGIDGFTVVLGGDGPYRIVENTSLSRGIDVLRFQVTTADGVSNEALVQIVYASPTSPGRVYCRAPEHTSGSGTRIGWTGTPPSLGSGTFRVDFRGAPPGAFAIPLQGRVPTLQPAGNGFLCVATDVARNPVVQADAAGGGRWLINPTAPPPAFSAIAAGEEWGFQFWHRDAAGVGYTFSDALLVEFLP